MSQLKLSTLGGEPVVLIAAFAAAAYMADSFGWLKGIGIHGQHSVALLVVVFSALGGVYTAIVTHRTLLAPAIALFTALVNLGVIYGLNLTTEQTGLVVTFLTAVFALFHQSQTSPVVATSAPPAAVTD